MTVFRNTEHSSFFDRLRMRTDGLASVQEFLVLGLSKGEVRANDGNEHR